ncbi:hypothetical protein CDAR_221331 [Caerostris darwini]|uniref:Uncharacterized protein n=1 Tax=Caerostris darwini TaxID=1538125 RepID=A0AAV4WKN6_9ARAC|nr:hypothetical protein CDAR_221331 [Caerostris darwini]
MALNSTILPVTASVNTSVASSAECVIEKNLGIIFTSLILILTVGFSCYFCCFHHKLVPYLRKKFRKKTRGRSNRRVHFGRNHLHEDYVDIPVPPLRRASSTPDLSDKLSPEDRRASRHGTRGTRMGQIRL